jgi:iron complex transport system substrate-binding protein
VDDAGAEVVLEVPPTRILSLVPSATEILVALGQLDRLVGRTDFDVEGPVAALPSVGGGLGPSMERVVSLAPDLVIRFRAESDPATAQQLDARGIVHLAIRPDGIGDIRRIIRLLGSVVGTPSQADSLNAAIQAELDEVSTRVRGAARPRVAFLSGDPPSVAGPNTFLHELVERAGGVNAFADIGALYAQISVEEVLRREIDMILTPEGTPIPEALERITVRRVPLAVLTPGIHVGATARLLATLLHPERFP